MYYEANADFDHCTFCGNGAPTGGTLLSTGLSAPRLSNCILANSPQGEAVWTDDDPGPSFRCSDIYGNAGGDWIGPIVGQFGINGNISADPLFCDAAGGDFRLRSESPCLPGANPSCGLIGDWPIGCPNTAVGADPLAGGVRLTVTPNPSRRPVHIGLEVGGAPRGTLVLSIHDAAGRIVRTLAALPVAPGRYSIEWDGCDTGGRPMLPGLYFSRARVGERTLGRTLVLLR